MNNKTTILVLYMIMMFLLGCANETTRNEKTSLISDSIQISQKNYTNFQKIVGTWKSACYYEQNSEESYQAELEFYIDNTYSYTEITYPVSDCTGDFVEQTIQRGTYLLGDKTKASDNKQAFDFEIHTQKNGQMYHHYFMVRFIKNQLVFTEEKEDLSQPDGKTKNTRNNYFSTSPKILFFKYGIDTK